MTKIEGNNMKDYWSNLSKKYIDTDKFGWGAVCYTGMPFWFNKFFDKFQKKCFSYLFKDISLNNKEILDVGCGVGRWLDIFSDFSDNITGIDIDKIRLEKAEDNLKGKKVSILEMRADNMDFKDESFDIVNSITVLQHIPYKEKFKAIAEMCRVCKKGGYISIIELIDEFDDAGHVFPLKKSERIKRFEENGFILQKEIGYEYIPLLRFLRYMKYKIKGEKTIDRVNGKVKLSFLEKIVLRIVIFISYPIEIFCLRFISPRKARHIGLLFKKI